MGGSQAFAALRQNPWLGVGARRAIRDDGLKIIND